MILNGHVLEMLPTLPSDSVQCIVTSPPYWGLRDYGVEGQLGLEATFGEFLANQVAVFEECRRILKPDGTLWLNMGDGYSQPGKRLPGCKEKDLIGQPWRLAFALQEAGWFLRQDIIWHKPNAMPESVGDRCTKAHEYLFLLTKRARYYFDQEAIKEPTTGTAHPRGKGVNPKARQKVPAGWDTCAGSHGSIHKDGRQGKTPGVNSRIHVTRSANGRAPQSRQNESFSAAVAGLVEFRNKRSVWSIASKGYPGAHFATFPPALVRPCVLAGSRPGDTVLDPYGGSGTTAQVAQDLGRKWILVELNAEYVKLARQRLESPAAAVKPERVPRVEEQTLLFPLGDF